MSFFPVSAINNSPSGRHGHAIGVNEKGTIGFIFGGQSKKGLLNDLWSFEC